VVPETLCPSGFGFVLCKLLRWNVFQLGELRRSTPLFSRAGQIRDAELVAPLSTAGHGTVIAIVTVCRPPAGAARGLLCELLVVREALERRRIVLSGWAR